MYLKKSKSTTNKTNSDNNINKKTSETNGAINRVELIVILFTLVICIIIIVKIFILNKTNQEMIDLINHSEKFSSALTPLVELFITQVKKPYYISLTFSVATCTIFLIVCECIKSNAECIKNLNNELKKEDNKPVTTKKDTEEN